MKRRKAIRNLVLFSLGVGVIYSCKDKYEAIQQLNLKYLKADPNQLDLLDDLSKLIVPLQQIPDLINHTALPFIMNTVDKLYDAKDRQLFVDGYSNFDAEVYIKDLQTGEQIGTVNVDKNSWALGGAVALTQDVRSHMVSAAKKIAADLQKAKLK